MHAWPASADGSSGFPNLRSCRPRRLHARFPWCADDHYEGWFITAPAQPEPQPEEKSLKKRLPGCRIARTGWRRRRPGAATETGAVREGRLLRSRRAAVLCLHLHGHRVGCGGAAVPWGVGVDGGVWRHSDGRTGNLPAGHGAEDDNPAPLLFRIIGMFAMIPAAVGRRQ